jgi:hypothetical protein
VKNFRVISYPVSVIMNMQLAPAASASSTILKKEPCRPTELSAIPSQFVSLLHSYWNYYTAFFFTVENVDVPTLEKLEVKRKR